MFTNSRACNTVMSQIVSLIMAPWFYSIALAGLSLGANIQHVTGREENSDREEDLFTSHFSSRSDAGAAFHSHGKLAAEEANIAQTYMESSDDAPDPDWGTPLALFRAAVKADPDNIDYQLDLGILEANLGLLHKARGRFLVAQRMEPDNTSIQRNLRRLEAEMTQELQESGLSTISSAKVDQTLRESGLLHHVLPLREFSELPSINAYHDPLSSAFSAPFVVRRAVKLPPSSDSIISASLKQLLRKYASDSVGFYPHNMYHSKPSKLFTFPLLQAASQILHFPDQVYRDVDASLSGSYMLWNMDTTTWRDVLHTFGLLDSLPIPYNAFKAPVSQDTSFSGGIISETSNDPISACFAHAPSQLEYFRRQTHWTMLLLGETDAGMFNHKDDLRTASFQVQLVGRKHWNLCPPEHMSIQEAQDPNMASKARRPAESSLDPAVDALDTYVDGWDSSYLYFPAAIDTLSANIDYEKYPKFVNATCHQVVLEPGDVLYYPVDYWHQTKSLDSPTMSVTSNVITRESIEPFMERIKAECAVYTSDSSKGETCLGAVETGGSINKAEGICHETPETTPKYAFTRAVCESLLACSNSVWPDMFGLI